MIEWLLKFKRQEEFRRWKIEELDISDANLYAKYIKETNYQVNVWSSNFSYLWAHTKSNNLKIFKAYIDNMLVTIILYKNGRLYLPCLPFGKGDAEHIIHVLLKCANFFYIWNLESKYKNMSIVNPINSVQLEFLNRSKRFENLFKVEKLTGLERHFSINKLIELKGREFSNIRNKRNKFCKTYPNALVRRYKKTDFNSVMKVGNYWKNTSGKKYKRIIDGFYFESIIKNYQTLNHIILVVELDGEIIGMTSGEILPTGQAWGCLTKYKKEYTGLTEFLTVSIVKEINKIDPKVQFINVGSDLGSKGLAFSKERYRPVMSYERYAVFYKN